MRDLFRFRKTDAPVKLCSADLFRISSKCSLPRIKVTKSDLLDRLRDLDYNHRSVSERFMSLDDSDSAELAIIDKYISELCIRRRLLLARNSSRFAPIDHAPGELSPEQIELARKISTTYPNSPKFCLASIPALPLACSSVDIARKRFQRIYGPSRETKDTNITKLIIAIALSIFE